MEQSMPTQERQLCQYLADLPESSKFRYTPQAHKDFIQNLFWSLAGKPEFIHLFFPNGRPRTTETWKLRAAQDVLEGAEYTEGARGYACGHILKNGEASYSCRTCSVDDTCVLCSRCFDATDHTGHLIRMSISPGNSGCCDCGDPEAWKVPLFCTIHSELPEKHPARAKMKDRGLPDDLVKSIRMTIARVIDFMCDVISCSPEQLRLPKTKTTVEQDEKLSRLGPPYLEPGMEDRHGDYALILWNDEKHTIEDVKNQVARACKVSEGEGLQRARETDTIGRSILKYDADLDKLLAMANILEHIKVTVTIRSSRDTFREQMCGAIVDWLSDIAGCRVGNDHHILRNVVCEELMRPWNQGSLGTHAQVGKNGIDDEANSSIEDDYGLIWQMAGEDTIVIRQIRAMQRQRDRMRTLVESDDEMSDEDEGNETPLSEDDGTNDDEIDQIVWNENNGESSGDRDVRMSDWPPGSDQALEEDEATLAGYPPPPPPPARRMRERDVTPSDSDTAEPFIPPTISKAPGPDVPKTPGARQPRDPQPGKYWMIAPEGYFKATQPGSDDRYPRARLDWLILFDLRMWKRVRNDLRALYISSVVTIPEFKKTLGIHFAGLYTTLAQLYLIADREPDHSIINLSLQMLTTPSITVEIIERGNFLTNLMAILYTFLTTRQVGHPWEVNSNAVLAFDTGSVTNRRMYHFLQDLKYLFQSPHVQERVRTDECYLMQFLDLVKLNQGICPNIRAVSEHVEYEADTWIGASMINREINKLCRQISDAFRDSQAQDSYAVKRAIRLTTKNVIISSIGAERNRFQQAEIKDEIRFKSISDFEFDTVLEPTRCQSFYKVVKFLVEEQPISFYHALHYTWSWLIECGKFMDPATMRGLLYFTAQDLKAKPKSMGKKQWPRLDYDPEDYLMAAFDYPLRVCAWLAQMKAGMWVRNGLSLRHQSITYRNILQRDVSHQRDIFLLQTALVICDPSRMLASIIDRYGMENWVKGIFEQKTVAQDDSQHLDVVEDMIHLLIVLLSDRTSLLCPEDEPNPFRIVLRRDIAHVLCFKPLSFSEICSKLPDRFHESEEFHAILNEMATFKPPEGVSDVGTFELRPECVEHIDPYSAHYTRNQREEAEAQYKRVVAKKMGKKPEDVVYEPKLRPITAGLFARLARFTDTGMFAQIIYYCLLYPLVAAKLTPTVPLTRVETFLQVVLHLILIAISEDRMDESIVDSCNSQESSFVFISLSRIARSNFMHEVPEYKSIVSLLHLMSTQESLKTCHSKIGLILKRMKQKRPRVFERAYTQLGVSVDRVATASPAINNADEERERKKKAALERQAKVMAQFQKQQQNFLAQQGSLWDDMSEDEEEEPQVHQEHRKLWRYPEGRCILCTEDTDDKKLYGTFALFINSKILRQTDFQDQDFVREASNTPCSLDRSADDIRPFGVAQENRKIVEKINAEGETIHTERQVIGKGFPGHLSRKGPVAVGCGHIMHRSCFNTYIEAAQRRHTAQIARHHPEDLAHAEFVCPLCKALGNAFLPIIWKGKEEAYPGALHESEQLDFWEEFNDLTWQFHPSEIDRHALDSLRNYINSTVINSISDKIPRFETMEAWLIRTRVESGTGGSPDLSDSASSFLSDIITPNTSQPSLLEAANSTISGELVSAYRRLRDTFRVNNLSRYSNGEVMDTENHTQLSCHDALARSLGFSISSVEIQQRGIEAQYGLTLVDKIPEQTLTLLRILSETACSYSAFSVLREQGDNLVGTEISKEAERQAFQIYGGRALGKDGFAKWSVSPTNDYPPLLEQDVFVFLCEAVCGIGRLRNIGVFHLARLCYMAEIVKVVHHMSLNIEDQVFLGHVRKPHISNDPLRHFATFAFSIYTTRGHRSVQGRGHAFEQPGLNNLQGYYNFVRKYALVFLRKLTILLHVYSGVDFNSHFTSNPDADELDRLQEALRMPSFDDMITAVAEDSPLRVGLPVSLPSLIFSWTEHHFNWRSAKEQQGVEDGPHIIPWHSQLSHPGIFELVGLPKDYGTLIEESTRRKCPTTGKDVVDAGICLFCGEIFCLQSVCCLKEEALIEVRPGRVPAKIGGSQQHMRRCQGNISLVLNIKKCCIFYTHLMSGSWSNAPYVDRYGEVDMALRHGRLLSLSQKRYDAMLRNLWLSHGIPTYISRKLEAELNTGGWETI